MRRRIAIAVMVLLAIAVVGTLTYVFLNMPPPQTKIYVNPENVAGQVGQTVSIQIDISDVTDLYGYEFELSWNTAVLELVNATEGTFLKKGENETFFNYAVNATAGLVRIDCSLLGDVNGINGKGLLATLELQAKANGNCDLVLSSTQLQNSREESIGHSIGNGHFSTPAY